jgi:hypothetical protein
LPAGAFEYGHWDGIHRRRIEAGFLAVPETQYLERGIWDAVSGTQYPRVSHQSSPVDDISRRNNIKQQTFFQDHNAYS